MIHGHGAFAKRPGTHGIWIALRGIAVPSTFSEESGDVRRMCRVLGVERADAQLSLLEKVRASAHEA
jgi:hypothetical protein